MAQPLSSTTTYGPLAYLSTCLLLAVSSLWLGHYWMALGWLGLLALKLPSCWWYQVTLTTDGLRLQRLFSRPIHYQLADFEALAAPKTIGRPVRISFTDGRSYLFQPVLRQSAWDLRYVPVAGFLDYWTERLREPACFEGQVWPDDAL